MPAENDDNNLNTNPKYSEFQRISDWQRIEHFSLVISFFLNFYFFIYLFKLQWYDFTMYNYLDI